MRLSHSSIQTYKQCSLKYKYKNIDKLKESKSKEAVFGTLIHSALKLAHTPALVPTPLEEVLDYFTRSWNTDLYATDSEERGAFTQGISILQKYYKDVDVGRANIVALESRFQFEVGPESDRHTISGIIDRIDKTDTGYEIIDYKTSKKLPSQADIDRDAQMTIYLRAFLERYPKEYKNIKNITVSLYFLKHGVKLSSTRTTQNLADMETDILAVTDAIRSEKFDPIVTPLCDWCGFQKLCPMWKHKFKEDAISDTEARTAIDELFDLKAEMSAKRKKIAELQSRVRDYMKSEDVDRVFGDRAVIATSVRETHTYDIAGVRDALNPLDHWNEVIKVDGTALKKLLTALPDETAEAIRNARTTRVTQTLSVKRR